jgi:transposase
VGKIGKSYCQTDKISAVRLARVYLTGLSDEVWVPDPKTRERREVFTSYQQAVTDCTRCSNRIKSMLNGHTLRMKKGQKNLTNPSVRDLVMTAREWTPTQYSLLDEGFEDLYRANNKRNRLRKMMVREIVEDPTMLQLVRIFGIQKIAAYGLMAMIGDAYRFSSPKKLAAYFGLNPRLKQSGKIIRLFGISKRGRRDVRALLVQAAQTVVRHRSKANPLHTWAWRMLFRKDRNVAIVAIARKIAVAIWYVLMGLPFKVRERSETLVRKLRSFAKDLGKDQVRAMGFSTYNAFIENRLKLIEEFSCRGGHT